MSLWFEIVMTVLFVGLIDEAMRIRKALEKR